MESSTLFLVCGGFVAEGWGGRRSDKTSNLLGRKELIKRWARRKACVFLELLSDLLRDRKAHARRWRACKSSEEERTSRRDRGF